MTTFYIQLISNSISIRHIKRVRKKLTFYCGALVLFFLSLSAFPTYSQIKDYKFNHINFDDGLSNLSVSCFAKDEIGYIWIGTEDGLNRFDGKNLKVFKHNEESKNSISNNNILTLLATNEFLWIGNEGYGIDRYNLKKDEFENFNQVYENGTPVPKNVNAIVELKNKDLLIGADNGLFTFDNKNEKFSYYFQEEAKKLFSEITVNSLLNDGDKIWLGTDKDVFCIYQESKKFFHFQSILALEQDNHWVQRILKGPDNRYYVVKQNWLFILDSNFEKIILKKEFDQYLSGCTFDIYGRLWITCDGLVVFDGQDFLHLKHDPLNPFSISDKLTKSIFIDNKSIIWVGTWNNGVSFFNPDNERHRIKNLIKRPDGKGLPENPVDFVFEDIKKRIWIGTNWGGITIYNLNNGEMRYISNAANSNPKISANLNYSAITVGNKVWLGTYRKGLDCFDMETERIKNYPIPVINGQMPKINKIIEDFTEPNTLLLATEEGLISFNTLTSKTYYYSLDKYNIPKGEHIEICHLDSSRTIIIVDKVGLYLFNNINKSFQPFLQEEISSNLLNTVKIDHENGLLLIGANNGLNVLDLFSNKMYFFNSDHGFYNENIIGILKDNRNFFWLSTVDGLILIDLKRSTDGQIIINNLRNINSSDGLAGNQFRDRSLLKTSDDKLLFGSNSGLSIFDSEIFSFKTEQSNIIISDVKIFNQTVKVDPKNEDAILNKSIFYTDKIELSFRQNSVSFDFTALDYFSNQIPEYTYMLEGFDENWIPNSTGTAVYTNLNPGNYIFKVNLGNGSLTNDEASKSLVVNIRPPFYQTKFFIFGSITFFVIAVFTFYFLRLRYYKNRQIYLENVVAERTNELKLANDNLLQKNNEIRSMAKKVHEADEMKLRFFSNVHHEFRTALSLIIGPVEQIKMNKSVIGKIGDDVNIISSNAKRLFGFVNEILDYRKIDAGKLNLNLTLGDAIDFLKDIKILFDNKAKELQIKYTFQSTIDTAQIYFDSQKVEHIVFNLLSNAFKYTERKGTINVMVCAVESHQILRCNKNSKKQKISINPAFIENRITSFLEIAVIDNGIGFKDKEHIRLIWERFYRLPNKSLTSKLGSGIGLALTKELTQIHYGLVFAESNEKGGATFRVWIPMNHDWFTNINSVNIVEDGILSTTRIADVEETGLPQKSRITEIKKENNSDHTILIIEDNPDIHLFLGNHLTEYKLWFESNGKGGIESAKEIVPDLIVCDIMLPDIHGYHIVKELKNDPATSHIPIIMLTALVGEDNMIKALNIGADDYVTKPFTINTLKARINNLLNLREKLREIYSLKSDVKPEEISTNPVEQNFFKNLNEIISKNMENQDFSVVNLAEQIGMSRTQLYRKVNSITKKGPADLIRKVRLKHSKVLLKKGNLAVADIAIKVGYSESSSFIRAFIQEFGISPLNYAKKHSISSPAQKL